MKIPGHGFARINTDKSFSFFSGAVATSPRFYVTENKRHDRSRDLPCIAISSLMPGSGLLLGPPVWDAQAAAWRDAFREWRMVIDFYKVYRYTIHSDPELPSSGPRFFRTGSKAGIQPKHATRLRLQLFALDNARTPADMNAPGWKLHRLVGALADHWAVSVSGNWRLTFRFEDEDAILVDYQDYH